MIQRGNDGTWQGFGVVNAQSARVVVSFERSKPRNPAAPREAEAGFDAEMFVKRGGVYDWTKQRDIEDLGEERWTGWTYTVDPVGGPGVKLQRCWLVAMKLAGAGGKLSPLGLRHTGLSEAPNPRRRVARQSSGDPNTQVLEDPTTRDRT